MSELTPAYTTTATQRPTLDALDSLPDDERRILLAWRNARLECRNGTPALVIALVKGEVILWAGMGAGKFPLR